MSHELSLVQQNPTTPLEHLVDDFLASAAARGLSPATDIAYGFALHRVLLPWCRGQGLTRVSDLDQRTLDRYSRDLLTRPNTRGGSLSKHTVHTYIRPVRQMLAWAATYGEEIKGKPQLPKLPRLRRAVLSRAELDRLEAAAASERDRVIIRLFGDCGLRLNELLRLRRCDIVRTGRATYLDVMGKGRRERRVPISPVLVRRIERHLAARVAVDDVVDGHIGAEHDHLFLAARRNAYGLYQPLQDTGVKKLVAMAGRRARLGRRVHPHLLRHSWMTEMLRRGMNPIQLSVIAGASQDVIAEHYEHLTEVDAYSAMMRALSVGEARELGLARGVKVL